MKKFLTLSVVLFAVATQTFAQGPINGTLTAASTDCTVAESCLVISVGQNAASVSVQLSGTFSGTVQFEATVGPIWRPIQATLVTDGTQATSSSSTGVWVVPVAGLSAFRVRASTYSSGAVTVDMRTSQGAPIPLSSSFSGSIAGNAAAGTIGSGPPDHGDYLGVNDVTSGFLTGVTGTAVGGKETINIDVLASTLPVLAATSTKQSDGSQKGQVVAGDGTVLTFTGTSANVNVTGGVSPGVAQGATTSGQLVTPAGCATTTSPPSNTTAQTNMISCDGSGNQRVIILNTPTVTVGGITNVTGTVGSGLPSAAIQVMFSNSGGTASQVLKLDGSGNVPVSGSLTVSPNATFGSAAPSTGFMMGFRNGSNADYAVTNSSHQPQMEIAAITAAASGPQANSGADAVVISPYQLSWTDASIALTTGGTSQTLIATNASRHGFCVQNPLTAAEQGIGTSENININFTSAASDTGGHSITLAPGASYCEAGGQVTTEAITVNAATTAHIIIAKSR